EGSGEPFEVGFLEGVVRDPAGLQAIYEQLVEAKRESDGTTRLVARELKLESERYVRLQLPSHALIPNLDYLDELLREAQNQSDKPRREALLRRMSSRISHVSGDPRE